MQTTKIPPTIKPAGYARSLLGYAIDFLCTLAVMAALYFAVGRTAMRSLAKTDEYQETYASYVERSHLGTRNGVEVASLSFAAVGNEGADYEYGYQAYAEHVYLYYQEVGNVSGDSPFAFVEGDGFEPSFKDTTSEDYRIELGKWIYRSIFMISGNATERGDVYFKSPDSDAGYLLVPSVNDEYAGKLADASTRQETAEKLLKLFTSTDTNDTIYNKALTHFNAQAVVKDAINHMNISNYLQLVPSLVVGPLVFYFIVPICSKNGRSIGKRIADTAVIGDDGYTAKKSRILLHYGFVLLEWETMLIPSFIIGMMVYLFLSIIGFMVLVMSKNHQSVHDKIARTIVIRYRDSIWFDSKESEEEYIKNNPSSLVAKLRRKNNPEETPVGPDGRRLVVTEEQLLAEESILDLSTINRRREEARNMTSFDEFERTHGGVTLPDSDTPSNPEETPEEEEELELTEQEKADLLALEGELPEEESDIPTEREEIEDEDDFVDEK